MKGRFQTLQSRILFSLCTDQAQVIPSHIAATKPISIFYCVTLVGVRVSESAVLHVNNYISQRA